VRRALLKQWPALSRFYGLFPTEVSAIDVNWNDTDTIETFQVTWAYDYYEVVGGNTGTVQ
jgi:hypothetical protein